MGFCKLALSLSFSLSLSLSFFVANLVFWINQRSAQTPQNCCRCRNDGMSRSYLIILIVALTFYLCFCVVSGIPDTLEPSSARTTTSTAAGTRFLVSGRGEFIASLHGLSSLLHPLARHTLSFLSLSLSRFRFLSLVPARYVYFAHYPVLFRFSPVFFSLSVLFPVFIFSNATFRKFSPQFTIMQLLRIPADSVVLVLTAFLCRWYSKTSR